MTGETKIRPARAGESDALTHLAIRSKASWGYGERFMADCAEELTISEDDLREGAFFVLAQDGRLIGFYGMKDRGDGEAEIIDLFVEPGRLREGHGGRLMAHARAEARARGLRCLLVESDPNARDFYRGCGGEEIGTVPSGSIPGRRLPLMRIPVREN